MIYTRKDIITQLKALGIDSTDTILVHSSMKSIGHVEKGADEVLDAFIEHLKEGLLIFPTHTWAQINENNLVFDPKTESSCVGVLTNLFLQRPGVVRSNHPTHSVAAIGNNAESYIENDNNGDTPCSRLGCWGKLYDIDAKILFVGCSLKRNTIIHGVEEWCNISNRLSKEKVPFKVKTSTGGLFERPTYTHFNPVGDISENYDKIEEALLDKRIARIGQVGDAKTYVCDTKAMVDFVSDILFKMPDFFLDNLKMPTE